MGMRCLSRSHKPVMRSLLRQELNRNSEGGVKVVIRWLGGGVGERERNKAVSSCFGVGWGLEREFRFREER